MSLDRFFEALAVNPDKVCYGKRSVEYAMDNQAVETLMISDKLFRAKNLVTRKAYVSLVDKAERLGVSTMIFSSMNPSGERLDTMSGVAALLRFPLPGIDDIEEEDVDIDELINQEGEEEKEEEEEKGERKAKKPAWDEELLYKMLEEAGGDEEEEEVEEEDT